MSKVKFKFENGDLLEDNVTGLTGVVMVRAEYSTGCHHYGILPQELNKDGAIHDWHWLDSSRLTKIEKNAVAFNINNENPSGAFPSGPE